MGNLHVLADGKQALNRSTTESEQKLEQFHHSFIFMCVRHNSLSISTVLPLNKLLCPIICSDVIVGSAIVGDKQSFTGRRSFETLGKGGAEMRSCCIYLGIWFMRIVTNNSYPCNLDSTLG